MCMKLFTPNNILSQIKIIKYASLLQNICYIFAENFARILLLDYTKAFDLINHHVLLKKLEVLYVPGLLIQWVKSFLTNRMQQVRVGKNFSTW